MNFVTFYWYKAPWIMVYMMQQVEYDPYKFADWVDQIPNLRHVQRRGTLTKTKAAKGLLLLAYLSWGGVIALSIIGALLTHHYGLLLLVGFAPLICILTLFFGTFVVRHLLIDKQQAAEIAAARKKLQTMSATRIAVLGSYGKTTMKELLLTVLAQGKKVVATPGNKNVLISHARWLNKVDQNTEILIFEYGEGEPGDIARLAAFSQPQLAVVTGLAPAHLDGYSSVRAIAEDLGTIQQFVPTDKLYVNTDGQGLEALKGHHYSHTGVGSNHISDVEMDMHGMRFSVTTGHKKLKLHTSLIGEHQLGPLSAVVAMALELGLSDKQIIDGVAATMSFEHRMQPRPLAGGWIIDDTYNGNIEGMRAGLELLKKLPAQRKIYVTPGLVDQGAETEAVHHELGRLIAEAKPDKVVLMRNSVTELIQHGLTDGHYNGEVSLQDDPLDYYTHLEHFIAAGDLVLMQNDWPDNYL